MLQIELNISKIWKNNLKLLKVKLEKWLTAKNKKKKRNKIKNSKLSIMTVHQKLASKFSMPRNKTSKQKLLQSRMKTNKEMMEKELLSTVLQELISQITSNLRNLNIIKVNQSNWLLKLNLSQMLFLKTKRKTCRRNFKKKKMRKLN